MTIRQLNNNSFVMKENGQLLLHVVIVQKYESTDDLGDVVLIRRSLLLISLLFKVTILILVRVYEFVI